MQGLSCAHKLSKSNTQAAKCGRLNKHAKGITTEPIYSIEQLEQIINSSTSEDRCMRQLPCKYARRSCNHVPYVLQQTAHVHHGRLLCSFMGRLLHVQGLSAKHNALMCSKISFDEAPARPGC